MGVSGGLCVLWVCRGVFMSVSACSSVLFTYADLCLVLCRYGSVALWLICLNVCVWLWGCCAFGGPDCGGSECIYRMGICVSLISPECICGSEHLCQGV